MEQLTLLPESELNPPTELKELHAEGLPAILWLAVPPEGPPCAPLEDAHPPGTTKGPGRPIFALNK